MKNPDLILTSDRMRILIRKDIVNRDMTQNRWAKKIGRCHPSYLSSVLHGNKPPTPGMARALGYERVYSYRKVER